MTLQALGEWVIVRPTAPEARPDGIVLPSADKPVRGEVVSAGREVSKKLSIGIGSLVMWERHAGQTVRVGEEDLLVMQAQNLIAHVYE